jgi:hypothetical protein
VASRKFGVWGKVKAAFDQASKRINDAARKALLQEGHRIRAKMLEGIREQAPGGKQFKPLSPLTLAARRLAGFRGTKALMVHGDLRNGITVSMHGAQVQEWGALIVLELTDKMRRYLGVLMREAELAGLVPSRAWSIHGSTVTGRPSRTSIVIRVPPRPFVRPTFEAHAQPADVKQRLEARMAELLKGDFAK